MPDGSSIGPGLGPSSAEDRQAAGCWFDEPVPGDRRSWAVRPGHGTQQGLDLELLNRVENARSSSQAQHAEFEDALRNDEEMLAGGEPFGPRLHITLHQVVARQLLADDPPGTWPTAQRLPGLGYDWHDIIHMIAAVVGDDLYQAVNSPRPFDPGDYARRLGKLPGDWPPPQALRAR